MLETVREFGLERLADSGEEAAIRAAHAAYCLALAERTAPLVRGSGARAALAALEREHGNLRAALAWFEARRRGRGAPAAGGGPRLLLEHDRPLDRGQRLAGARPGRRPAALARAPGGAGEPGRERRLPGRRRPGRGGAAGRARPGPPLGRGGEGQQHAACPRGAAGGPGPLRGGRDPPRRVGGRGPAGGRPLRRGRCRWPTSGSRPGGGGTMPRRSRGWRRRGRSARECQAPDARGDRQPATWA